MRIALFITCYNDTLFPRTGQSVVRVLERLGHTVEFPLEQTCCGQMHFNTGYAREAYPLAKRFVEIFADAEAVCIPSSSCVAMIREYYPALAREHGDAAMAAAVDRLLPRVFEFSELLVDRLGVTDVGAYFPHRVTYHASCHGLRSLHLGDKPMQLLRAVARAGTGATGRPGAVLRLRRDLRGEECGRLRRHVDGQDPCGAEYARRGLHGV